jgi:hypothetical protein
MDAPMNVMQGYFVIFLLAFIAGMLASRKHWR